jgi:hypothetical protein
MRMIAALLAVLIAPFSLHADEPATHDVVVYGATSGGAIAAIQTVKLGKTVVIVEPGRHVGGLSSGGLGATDIGNKQAIGGLSREFYRRIRKFYISPITWEHETVQEYAARKGREFNPSEDTMWTFEPKVAEHIFREMLAEYDIPVVFQQRLDLKNGVKKEGNRITTIVMESGRTFSAKMFIDATYEGDLMAKAGVKYHVGREGNSVYSETLNGVQPALHYNQQFRVSVDPYVVPGDPKSGLLHGVHDGGPGEPGAGDNGVQAYNFRMCWTDVPKNRVPFPKPADYDPAKYELLLRTVQAGGWDGFGMPIGMPNRKTDTNNYGAVSTDNIGMNYDYPDGDYETRERIYQEHVNYQQGWCWFICNDPRMPKYIRDAANQWGLPRDEFVDNRHWPHQLYVREARRMIADYVMTEHDCRGNRVVDDPVGLAAYNMDSHNVQRYVKNGFAINEGDVQVPVSPYPVSYRAIVPKQAECANLFVPICLSASHIAYGSIRMEPVFMVLGQSAATAAVQAINANCDVQLVEYAGLRKQLLADQQVLAWSKPRQYAAPTAAALTGTVVDDDRAELTGNWIQGNTLGGYVGRGYRHDDNQAKATKRAIFSASLPSSGKYEVRVSYNSDANRADNVPVTVAAADGEHRFLVDQKVQPEIDGRFHRLDVLEFEAGRPARVTIETRGTNGYVVIDAVQFVPVK